jgi:hypothetical protein
LACAGGIRAPLAQARHLLRQVEFGTALGLDDPNRAIGGLDDEIRCVGGEIAVGLDVVDLVADGEVVLGEGRDIGRVVEKTGESQFEAAGMWLANDLAEQRFLRREIRPVLGAEGAGVRVGLRRDGT